MYRPPRIIVMDEEDFRAYRLTGVNSKISSAWRQLCGNLSDSGIEEALKKGIWLRKIRESQDSVIKKVFEITVRDASLKLSRELELQSLPLVVVLTAMK